MVTARHGMVATDSPFASAIGRDVLASGGNAIDAATAVSFALAVCRPQSTGLGGGGFLIYRAGDTGDVLVLDFRETAPAAATADMFTGVTDGLPSQNGFLAVGVPGLVAGRIDAWRRFGTKPWSELTAPAAVLAREGIPIDSHYVSACDEAMEMYRRYPRLLETCGYVYREHLRGGKLPRAGDTLRQPALARLIDAIGRDGERAFYEGPVADAIVDAMRGRGGIITHDDLRGYRPTVRQPLISTYRDVELILMPPPSSGGICLAQTLNILERIDLPGLNRQDRATAAHYVVEAMKYAFADRARLLGDADFVDVPVSELMDKNSARALVLGETARPATDVTGAGSSAMPGDDAGTSHFCIIDRWGNVVSSTETINTSFGSLAAVDEWGLILNNEMDDFTARPGERNAFGLIQSPRNGIEPRKRPLSSMAPTIVLRGGKPLMVLGASGGPRIISSVLHVLLGIVDYHLDPRAAFQAVRPHHQWLPDTIYFDRAPAPALAAALRARGHSISAEQETGVVQAILVERSQLIGISDPRKGGTPAGY